MTSHRRTKFAAALRVDLAEDLRLLARASRREVAELLEAALGPMLNANRALIEAERKAKPEVVIPGGVSLDAMPPTSSAPKAPKAPKKKVEKVGGEIAPKSDTFDTAFWSAMEVKGIWPAKAPNDRTAGFGAVSRFLEDRGMKVSDQTLSNWSKSGIPAGRVAGLLAVLPELSVNQ